MDSLSKAAWSAAAFGISLLRAASADTPAPEFHTQAYHDPELASFGTTYRLMPAGEPGKQTADSSISLTIRSALAGQGWKESSDGMCADVEFTYAFDIVERVEPASRFSRRFRPVTHRVRAMDVDIPDEDGGTIRVRQQVVVPANDGYVSVSRRRPNVTLFEKRLVLSARETVTTVDPAGSTRELWRIVVTNKDGSDDVEYYACLMAAAAARAVSCRPDGPPRSASADRQATGQHSPVTR